MAVTINLQNQSLFVHAFHYAAIGMALVSPKGQWLRVNESLCHFLGFSEAELLQLTFQAITHPDDVDRDVELVHQMLEGKMDSYQLEKRYLHKSGEFVWGLLSVSLVRDDQGVPLYFIAQIQNITEKKRAEEEVQHSETRFRSVIEAATDAIILTDRSMNIIYWNRGAETIFGYKEEEVSGKPITFMIPERYRKAHQRAVKRFLETGETQVMGGPVELYGVRKDGSEFPLELSVNSWNAGEETYFSAIIRDISQRKAAERKLKASEEKYRNLVEEMPDAIMVGQGDRWVYVNQAAVTMLGAKNKEELLNRSVYDSVHPDYLENVRKRIQLVENSRATIGTTQEKFMRCDGKMIDVEVTCFPASYEGVHARQLLVRDVTEKRKTEELIHQSEKLSAAGQLAAGIVHEVRNPLTAIKGFIQLMRDDFKEKMVYYDIITAELERIELILSELLLLAKPQASRYQLTDVYDLIRHVSALIEAQANLHNIEIQTEMDPDLPQIYCDGNQLKQVCINFLKNGIESMPGGGKMRFQVKKEAENLLFRFVDEGCGIPDDLLSRLGEPFLTTKEQGTGLGVMISRTIIENHRGQLSVSSQVNQGTTVEIRLPMDGA